MKNCCYLSYQPNVESKIILYFPPPFPVIYLFCCCILGYIIYLSIHSFLLQVFAWYLSYAKLSAMDWNKMGHLPALKRLRVCKGSQTTKQIISTQSYKCYDVQRLGEGGVCGLVKQHVFF